MRYLTSKTKKRGKKGKRRFNAENLQGCKPLASQEGRETPSDPNTIVGESQITSVALFRGTRPTPSVYKGKNPINRAKSDRRTTLEKQDSNSTPIGCSQKSRFI